MCSPGLITSILSDLEPVLPVFFSSCRDGVNYFSARLVFALAGFALFPFAVEAAGLGNIRVRSALGERFDAAVTVTVGAGRVSEVVCR